ncbi:MAG: hypothetical protein V5B34_12300 [Accumulibacter sp.]|jgi:hypothetical protein|uniref:hypothetical protein n=1 Tax=Accumulibacter sp. TaxID=2053492 RepID=UPI002FC27FE3
MSQGSSSGPQRRRLQVVAGICVLGAGLGIGRYLSERPAPANLVIPVHRLQGENQVVVGEG